MMLITNSTIWFVNSYKESVGCLGQLEPKNCSEEARKEMVYEFHSLILSQKNTPQLDHNEIWIPPRCRYTLCFLKNYNDDAQASKCFLLMN